MGEKASGQKGETFDTNEKIIRTSTFVSARETEIKSLIEVLESTKHGKRVFQTLPRHMQRRQVSSRPKRLPHYMREKHKREAGHKKVTRRPSRKHRRRHRYLLAEYNRRQKSHVWLETHIWHAKRFRMTKRWGYTLPVASTCKGYRSHIRAAKKTCLLQDISYMSCIEIQGKKAVLKSGLSRITDVFGMTKLTQPKVEEGHLWEIIPLFKPDMQPYGALGDADVMWVQPDRCSEEEKSKIAKLWIWVHPSAHSHVVEALKNVYDLVKVDNADEGKANIDSVRDEGKMKKTSAGDSVLGSPNNEGEVDFIDKSVSTDDKDCGKNQARKRKRISDDLKRNEKRLKTVNGLKLEKRNVPFDRTPKYYSSTMHVSMTLLKDTLSRFRLTGPEAINVLRNIFYPANIAHSDSVNKDESKEMNDNNKFWWKDYYNDEVKLQHHQEQTEAWRKLSSSDLVRRMILPLTVRDPRITLPKKKCPINSTQDSVKEASYPRWPQDSPMISSDVRDKVVLSKDPDIVVNKRRSEVLVPGSILPESAIESRLPVILLSRPCTHTIGYGSGLDVIICSGWGMSVWLPIVLSGGVASGEEGEENLRMEFLTPFPPHLYPDTPAGDSFANLIAQEKYTKYFNWPPACRQNFIKLGVQYPFSSPWMKLIQDWVIGAEHFYVLRNQVFLEYLASHFGDAFNKMKRSENKPGHTNVLVHNKDKNIDIRENMKDGVFDVRKAETIHGNDIEEMKQSNDGSLVKVKIVVEGKGTLESCAMICLPHKEDLERKNSLKDHMENSVIEEPQHVDEQEEQRNKLKLEHGRIKRKIRKLKTTAKLNLEKEKSNCLERGESFTKNTESTLKSMEANNNELFTKHASYNSEMENLWLMKKDVALQCCSHKIMGYITIGNFNMTIGRSAGIGWVGVKPLLDHLKIYQNWKSDSSLDSSRNVNSVLVRNSSSLQYNWAKLYIIK